MIMHITHILKQPESIVGLVTCCELGCPESSKPSGGVMFQTHPDLPKAYPASCTMGYQVSFLEVKWPECGVDQSPSSSTKVEYGQSCTRTSLCFCLACYRTACTSLYTYLYKEQVHTSKSVRFFILNAALIDST